MKRILAIIPIAIAACLAFRPGISAEEQNGAEQIIRQLEENLAHAMVKRDFATIDRITATDWLLTDANGSIQTKAEADADLKSGDLSLQSFKINELKVRIYGDTAIVHGLETEQSKYLKEDLSGQYRFTDVFLKRAGRWQIVATHISKVAKD